MRFGAVFKDEDERTKEEGDRRGRKKETDSLKNKEKCVRACICHKKVVPLQPDWF